MYSRKTAYNAVQNHRTAIFGLNPTNPTNTQRNKNNTQTRRNKQQGIRNILKIANISNSNKKKITRRLDHYKNKNLNDLHERLFKGITARNQRKENQKQENQYSKDQKLKSINELLQDKYISWATKLKYNLLKPYFKTYSDQTLLDIQDKLITERGKAELRRQREKQLNVQPRDKISQQNWNSL
jgi:hypothetical protein